jgi:hypothetical protein
MKEKCNHPECTEIADRTCSICGNQFCPVHCDSGMFSTCDECADGPAGFDPAPLIMAGKSDKYEVCSNCGKTATILYGRKWRCECGRMNERKGSRDNAEDRKEDI